MMKSNLYHAVRDPSQITAQNHPIHPTTAVDPKDCPDNSHGSATPWGPACVASCAAGLSDRDLFSGVVGDFIGIHGASSSKAVSFENSGAAAPPGLSCDSGNLDVSNHSAAIISEGS